MWSMVETTIFTLIRFIQNRFGENSIIGKIIANILGGAWSILTYFSFSLLILSKKTLKESIVESGELFKKTWGERAILYVGTGFIFGIFNFAIIGLWFFLLFTAFSAQSIMLGIFSFIFVIILLMISGIFQGTTESIIRVLMLYYAISGKTPEFLTTTDIARIKE